MIPFPYFDLKHEHARTQRQEALEPFNLVLAIRVHQEKLPY